MRATLTPGAPLSFTIAVGGRELRIKAEMMTVEHGRELRWRGPPSFLLARAIRGEHHLVVEPAGVGRSRIVHGEKFAGVLVPLIWKKLRSELDAAYSEMNRAIKARAEAGGRPLLCPPSGRPDSRE